MVVNVPDGGLALESSAKAMAGLPMQAFAITLSDSVIEDMIECVQSGQGIQLSLGGNPAFLFDGQEVHIPNFPDSFDYDLFHSGSASPAAINKLPQPAMSIFRAPKSKPKAPKAPQPSKKEKVEKTGARIPTSKLNASTPRLAAVSDRDLASVGDDEAIANLKSSYAKVQAEKRENASTLIDGILPAKGPKAKQAKSKHLGPQVSNSVSRSHPGSPAFAPVASPSLGPVGTPAQDRLKQQRFPIIHELAVRDSTFDELSKKYDGGTEEEFSLALNKVADFVGGSQKWALKRAYWKELDVQEYEYDTPADRQKAIDNAIRQYDRMRLGVEDPLWQKLLPKAERNKGICLSKVQAAIASKGSVPKINVSKTDASSVSGADSEKDDSASSGAKLGKGGEPMSRSGSQTSKKKLSSSEAQVKRLLSNSKKPAPPAKASPKVSPTKSAPATKAAPAAKNGRVIKSKEYITDSDSDDEVPLSNSMPGPKSVTVPASKPVERVAEKVKVAERVKEPSTQKPKPTAAARPTPPEKEKDTIRAQVPAAKPVKAPVKRQRETEEDDSSSSGAPLVNKRMKAGAKTVAPVNKSVKQRTTSDASQNSRSTSSGNSLAKSKNTSPIKSSPLASSPPTNASELEQDRLAMARDLGRGRDREREIDRERDTIVSRAGSSTGSSTGSSVGGGGGGFGGSSSSGTSKKRPAEDLASSKIKRQRLSDEVIHKANKFKAFYSRYEALHKEISDLISAMRTPPEDRVAHLNEMHHRLMEMKTEIYMDVEV
ncbi:hypothetical protein B0T16DRAFT_62770 [Cercophora newfieldiana]|uniref:Uncharacterized protein n=1 Tax=Cercophora newfieldiana TaxID=92897 RepID=A0AA39YSX2_9PEZI|nr:hypothetical protein B0T16DRAFT_62770 [Cercophora newfieldiana]